MYNNLQAYIDRLDREGELLRIATHVDPVLEVAEVVDRVSKRDPSGNKALLFENTGTEFPLLINAMGSDRRMSMALGVNELDELRERLDALVNRVMGPKESMSDKLKMLPLLTEMSRWFPVKSHKKGACQQRRLQSLDELPVMQCWPEDGGGRGGRFITLPLVHTLDPDTGARNVGMYRMQLFDGVTTGMHWHIHKTGARHYEGYKRMGMRMPVTVALGGDPAYTYAATAPMPDNMDEYLLAGFLRRKPVRLVKCLTNDLWVPADCDFVIEGYVDPAEDKVIEGPFGDHTGFYSLEDLYPYFHVTAITRRHGAVYPATVVGIPPQEDYFIALATERIFIEPLRLLQSELTDMHMPAAGVAHNLALVSIDVSYPGQALKVAAAMWGAGQMMFNKVLLVLPSDVGLHDTAEIARRFRNADLTRDVLFGRGVADALDHAATTAGVSGKIALDLTCVQAQDDYRGRTSPKLQDTEFIEDWGVLAVYNGEIPDDTIDAKYIVLADKAAQGLAAEELLWHVLANIDPERDIELRGTSLIIDGRTKIGYGQNYPSRTPNVVVSTPQTIALVDARWDEYGLGEFIPSPSRRYEKLIYSDGAEVATDY